MKRKLLTVLLAVVMVFGVFGLTACSKSNPDSDYNYYGVKYELEDEVKIEAVTYQGVYRMFTTAGRFLLYVDSETSATAKADFQAINKLANEWDVTIYHFNPDLTGGYAKTATTANANIIKVTADDTKNIKTIRANFEAISKKTVDKWSDSSLVGIIGSEPTVTAGKLTYNGKVAGANKVADAVKSITAVLQARTTYSAQQPSFGAYTDEKADKPAIPGAYLTDCINTINCFADARLHMYDEKDDLTAEKEDVYSTIANYAMFAHLMDNNEGYFPVFFGGTWCGNTQAIAKATNDLAKDYGISKIYFFDPKLADGTTIHSVTQDLGEFSMDKYEEDVKYNIPAAEEALADAQEALDDNTDATKVASLTLAVEKAQKVLDDLKAYKGYTVTYTATKNGDRTLNSFNTRDSDANCEWAYAYASFLDNYLSTYTSEWNVGSALKIGNKNYTKMCVPNIMMFNGEGEGKAELVALAEAEYQWADMSVEGNPCNVAWTNAVKAVFGANPYATYAPVMVVEEAPAAESTTSSSSSAASSSASAGGC